jgi:coenzyme F420-0:L-glutamate ligase/coenzyme F420-1:gamma-L-glutamate ligase
MAHAWVQDTVLDDACKKPNAEAVKASIEKFTNAPVLVLMCISLEDMHTFNDERRRRAEHDLALQSLGAAVQNLLLTAQTLGLGACWHCAPAFCQETVRKVLQIPENIEPQALITVGFPAETPEAPMRKPLREIAYVNHWGNKL